jgi:hypothetical protein
MFKQYGEIPTLMRNLFDLVGVLIGRTVIDAMGETPEPADELKIILVGKFG